MHKNLLPALLAGGLLALTALSPVRADNYPEKSVRWIVPYAAGGLADTRARKIAEHLSRKIGQPVVIENRPGAGGTIGMNAIAKATPDGYTIGTGSLAPQSVNPWLMKNLAYDAEKDLVPVILVERGPLILSVGNKVPAKTLAELIALAKDKPGSLTFASSGVGGAHHLSGELLAVQAGIDIRHVPYKGGNLAATDVMAGHVPMMFEMGYAALPSLQSGKVRALGVTSSKRMPQVPDVPTIGETLPGFEVYNWNGVVAPTGVPEARLEKLNQVLNEVLKEKEVADSIINTVSEVGGGTRKEFGDFISQESKKWRGVIEKAGIAIH